METKKQSLFLCLSVFFVLFGLCTGVFAEEDSTPKQFVQSEENPYFLEPKELADLRDDVQEIESQVEQAQVMAKSAREIGLTETSAPIQYAKQYVGNAFLQKWITISKINEYDIEYTFSLDAFTPSYISAAGFDYLLKDTALSGQGKAFSDIELQYGVNGLFAMAVAKTESSLGESNYAINRNNYFGMIGCRFDTCYEGIMAFGKLMQKSLYNGKSIDLIAKIYCPPTYDSWANKNKSFMAGFWEDLSDA